MKPARGALVLAIALALVLGLVFLDQTKEALQAFLTWTQGIGSWGPPLLGVVYVLACVLFLPGSVLTLACGFLFGLWKGLLVAVAGSNVGAALAFLLGRTLARDWVAKKVSGNRRFSAIDQAVGQEGLKIVFLTRLSPVFPFNLLNFAFGATRVSPRDYLLGSVAGMLPGTLLYVYLGAGMKSLAEAMTGKVEGGIAQKILLGVGLAATVWVMVFITRVAKRSLEQAVSGGALKPRYICPFCRHEVAMAREEYLAHMTLDSATVERIRAMHPEWHKEDGACPECLEAFRKPEGKSHV